MGKAFAAKKDAGLGYSSTPAKIAGEATTRGWEGQMRNSQIQEVAMQTCAVGSSLLLLSTDASGPTVTGLLTLSLVLCSVALGAMLASFPGLKP